MEARAALRNGFGGRMRFALKRVGSILLVLSALAALTGGVPAQERDRNQPIRSDVQEREKVRLVLVETLAVTKNDATISDLKREDFEMFVGGEPVRIDTFDALCPIGDAPDPQVLKKGDPLPEPVAPGTPRKIVFVFDYVSLAIPNRQLVLDAAKSMINLTKTPEEEIMIVALADGLRIEQRFTTDKQEIFETLTRMGHDVTLWAREFGMRSTGRSYIYDVAGLLEVLEAYDGAKIAVLFSELRANLTTRDTWFRDVAERATLSRTAIYPNWAGGIQAGMSVQGSRILTLFATETGGRGQVYSNDISVQYRRAQRDLSCRYALGFYLNDDEDARAHQRIRIQTSRENVRLRYPDKIRLFTDDEKREMRERAAFVDPEGHDNPLVRAYAMPMRPNGGKWDTLLGLHFPMPVGSEKETVDLKAYLRRGGKHIADVDMAIEIPPTGDGRPGTQPVTVLGDTTLKPGTYDFTIVLSRAGREDVVSAHVPIRVPEVPDDGAFVRGPILARVVPEGVLVRKDRDEIEEQTQIDKVLKGHENIEPLVIQSVTKNDTVLTYWEACFAGKSDWPAGGTVARRLYGEGGAITLELDPVPFERPEGKGKVHCRNALEEIDLDSLPVRDYTFQVAVEDSAGRILYQSDVPLDVHE